MTPLQIEMITRLAAGEILHYCRYSLNVPAHCYWGYWFPGAPNPIVTAKSLMKRGYVEIDHRGRYGSDDCIVLTPDGWKFSETLPTPSSNH